VFYHFKIHKEKKGYWAECVELEGCATQADSREELDKNMAEALNVFLSEPEDSRVVFPLPRTRVTGKGVVGVPVEPRVAFAFRLRMLRLQHRLTQREAAQRIGLKGLFTYQKLESSKTANPVYETLVKIKKAFPEFNIEELIA